MGEQVTVTYKFTQDWALPRKCKFPKLPSYEGFWAEEINTSNNISFSTEMYDGKQYRVGSIEKSCALPVANRRAFRYAARAGYSRPNSKQKNERTISSTNFSTIRSSTISKPIIYTAKSNTIKLHVIPLPSKNVPKSFNGAVGRLFACLSQVSVSASAKTNEPLTLKINISGKGNIQLLNMPEINLPNGFDKYEPKTSEQIDRNGTISGTKTFEYLIIPRVAWNKRNSADSILLLQSRQRNLTRLFPRHLIQ